MTEIFTAFDISGVQTNVTTMLVVGVGIMLVFLGFKFAKRIGKAL